MTGASRPRGSPRLICNEVEAFACKAMCQKLQLLLRKNTQWDAQDYSDISVTGKNTQGEATLMWIPRWKRSVPSTLNM